VATFEVSVVPGDGISSVVHRVADQLDPSAALDEAGALVLARNRERFLAEQEPSGRPWVPSRASLVRARTGRGGGTLYDTGRLFHSQQVTGSGPQFRDIGTDVPYAGKLHRGRWPFLGFGSGDADAVEALLLKRIEEGTLGR